MAAKKSDDASFTAEERAAMKERAAELKSTRGTKGAAKKEKEAQDLKDKIAELPEPDRGLAQRVHEIVREVAPQLDASALSVDELMTIDDEHRSPTAVWERVRAHFAA